MKTLKKVEIIPVFLEGFMPDDKDIQELHIYISRQYNCAIHFCLCGCKVKTVTPLMEGEWTLTENEGKISFSPSIANYQWPCNSHYVITDNIATFLGE